MVLDSHREVDDYRLGILLAKQITARGGATITAEVLRGLLRDLLGTNAPIEWAMQDLLQRPGFHALLSCSAAAQRQAGRDALLADLAVIYQPAVVARLAAMLDGVMGLGQSSLPWLLAFPQPIWHSSTPGISLEADDHGLGQQLAAEIAARGVSMMPPPVLRAIGLDLLGGDTTLKGPLQDLLQRKAFRALLTCDGEAQRRVARDALLVDLEMTYQSAVLLRLTAILNGVIGLPLGAFLVAPASFRVHSAIG